MNAQYADTVRGDIEPGLTDLFLSAMDKLKEDGDCTCLPCLAEACAKAWCDRFFGAQIDGFVSHSDAETNEQTDGSVAP